VTPDYTTGDTIFAEIVNKFDRYELLSQCPEITWSIRCRSITVFTSVMFDRLALSTAREVVN